MTRRILAVIAAGSVLCCEAFAQRPSREVDALVRWLLSDDAGFKDVLFGDVIAAATGRRIVPVDLKDNTDRRIVEAIGRVMDTVLLAMNRSDASVQRVQRINEVSSHFEEMMREKLNAMPGFSCEFPRTADGSLQRSGYPDLRLVDKASGRIFYLDPKLHAKGSRESSFRAFYFEPKKGTNKVLDDARHLIVGIEHGGGKGEGWKFFRWELVDLSHFRVRLKAEFQGSNRDMYRPEAIVGSSRRQPATE